jgi:tRNA(Ile)-lysidine synthase
MLKKVLQTIHKHHLFAAGDTVVVAVSGGADSVALLDVLANAKELRLRLIIAHLNHRLRGAESDGDEAFVSKLAASYGVTFVTQNVDVKALSRELKLSLEEAGRVARYRFFDEIASGCKANVIALAHHADDQAETVLLRLLRGAGSKGLSAMSLKNRNYVRPLLAVTRDEIESYLRKRSLPFRTDSSNTDQRYLRNRIRHELIPFLANYNPAISERLAVTAELLAEDELLLDKLTGLAFARYVKQVEDCLALDIAGVAGEPKGQRLRIYRRAISVARGDLVGISYRHLLDLDELLNSSRPNGKLVLPGGFIVKRRYESLLFYPHAESSYTAPYEVLIEGEGSFQLGSCLLVLELSPPPKKLASIPSTVAYLDLGAFPFPWLARTFRAGDRIVPLGMTGSKKVKDVFIDAKIPLPLRRQLPLLFSGSDLLWVCGVKLAQVARITPSSSSIIRAEILGFLP